MIYKKLSLIIIIRFSIRMCYVLFYYNIIFSSIVYYTKILVTNIVN